MLNSITYLWSKYFILKSIILFYRVFLLIKNVNGIAQKTAHPSIVVQTS